MACEVRMLEMLNSINKEVQIEEIYSDAFKSYGKVLDKYDFTQLIDYMELSTGIPGEGNIYVASDIIMESKDIYKEIRDKLYGNMPIQIGYCNGRNSTLNGLEYHKGSEVNVAVTDLVLLLGSTNDIVDNSYDVKNIKAFYVPKGVAIELYQTTLHFAPCKVSDEGFKAIVILPRGTNEPLEIKDENPQGEANMKNKWLLAHPERKALVDKGAHIGILGPNIQINY